MDFLNGCEVELPPSCWCSQTVTVTMQTRKDGEFSKKALVLQQLGQLKVPAGHVTAATVPLSHVSRLRLNNNNNKKDLENKPSAAVQAEPAEPSQCLRCRFASFGVGGQSSWRGFVAMQRERRWRLERHIYHCRSCLWRLWRWLLLRNTTVMFVMSSSLAQKPELRSPTDPQPLWVLGPGSKATGPSLELNPRQHR